MSTHQMENVAVCRSVSGSGIKHSISTPSGVDETSTPRQRGGKKLAIRIQMLDDSVTMFQVQAKAYGKVLFEQVCRQLNLLEADYFGLEYQEQSTHTKYWLDLEKPLCRQVGLSLIDPLLRFCIKFYTPDPAQLEEEYTRYLFCLQIKRDLATGSLQCNDNTAALMASYIVQASCGDFVPEDYPDHTYLSSYHFVPHQDTSLQQKIMENHKKLTGQSPAEADLNLLETSRRCELYGMKMHPAKDIEDVPLNLSVAHMGVAVFQGITRINTFSWAKIRKISFKRKRFLIKLHPEGYGYYKDTVEFFFDGRNECKNFWKKCVENHGFFRCASVLNRPRRKSKVLSRGSSFRYSGKTQKQIVEFIRDNYVKRQSFQRSQSFRQGQLNASSRSQSHSYVNSSISANPLLPIDTAEWDSRNQCNTSKNLSLTTREMETLSHPKGNPTNLKHSQVTAAHVEIYQTKRYVPESNNSGLEQQLLLRAELGHLNSDKPVSPQNQQPWEYLFHNKINVTEQDQVQVHPEEYHLNVLCGISDSISFKDRLEKEKLNNLEGSRKDFEAGSYDIVQAETCSAPPQPSLHLSFEEKGISVRTSKKLYFLIKELLMTERTYKKNLDILCTKFRLELVLDEKVSLSSFVNMLESMKKHHSELLRDVEYRLFQWEQNGSDEFSQIDDILQKNKAALIDCEEYIETHMKILRILNEMVKTDNQFQQAYDCFEEQKFCYIPINELLLKPLYRILYYERLLTCICAISSDNLHINIDCFALLQTLNPRAKRVRELLPDAENFVRLCELQRNIKGFDFLVQQNRKFIRHGCLLKHSKKGLQHRIFFLFSDILIYGKKIPIVQSFHILGYVPVSSLLIENAEHNTFSILGGMNLITVSASTTAEKILWLAEFAKAVSDIKINIPRQYVFKMLKSCNSSEEGIDEYNPHNQNKLSVLELSKNKTSASRCNTALYVCWHRGATIGLCDYLVNGDNGLSSFLLRKFKNSSGWQKLWVVFSSFCLFFYKSYEDDVTLASLPLLGYSVSSPGHQDYIQKEYVFKLSFKNHAYFFRAESFETYNRWLEVLHSTTQTQNFKVPHVL